MHVWFSFVVKGRSVYFRPKKFNDIKLVNLKTLFAVFFILVLLGSIATPVYATRYVEVTKEVNVKKEFFAKELSDLRNYKEIFPTLIKSVKIDPATNRAKFVIEASGTHEADVKSSILPDGSFVVEILSGDLKGTKIITTLKERIGFDGTPKGATTVKTKLMLETSFWISLTLSFVGDSEIKNAVGDGFYDLGEYVKVKYPQETTKKTPKLEAAKALEPAKEAIKPQTTSSQNQQTKPKTSLQSTIEAQDKKSQMQTNPSIFAKTDKFSYSSGDQIIVFGAVNEIQKNLVVTILITRPDGETITVRQTDVSQNGKFADTFKASGPLWKTSGIYTVSVKYGILGYQTTFEFTNKMMDKQTNSQLYRINTSCEMLYAMSANEYPNGDKLHSLSITSVVSKYQADFGPWLETFADDKKLLAFIEQGFSPEFLDIFTEKIILEYSINPELKPLALLALDPKTQTVDVNKIFEEDNCLEYYVSRKGTTNTQSAVDISVKTNKSSYSDGEVIIVSGQVNEVLSVPLSLRVIAPNGHIILIEQIDMGSDKIFNTRITAGGNLWKAEGTYTVEISYGTTSQNTSTATTTFEFGGSSGTKD